MNTEDFKKVIEDAIASSMETLFSKNDHYNPNADKLKGFKVAAELQGITPRAALAGMRAKHTVSVYDILRSEELASPEMVQEKLGDDLNYILLAFAVIHEERGNLASADRTDTVSYDEYFDRIFRLGGRIIGHNDPNSITIRWPGDDSAEIVAIDDLDDYLDEIEAEQGYVSPLTPYWRRIYKIDRVKVGSSINEKGSSLIRWTTGDVTYADLNELDHHLTLIERTGHWVPKG